MGTQLGLHPNWVPTFWAKVGNLNRQGDSFATFAAAPKGFTFWGCSRDRVRRMARRARFRLKGVPTPFRRNRHRDRHSEQEIGHGWQGQVRMEYGKILRIFPWSGRIRRIGAQRAGDSVRGVLLGRISLE